MDADDLALAVTLGLVQGLFEWLPVSSEGSVALALTATGEPAAAATQFALLLHVGTAVAALTFYRGDVRALVGRVPDWRPGDAFGDGQADLTFYAIATLVSGVVGLAAYFTLEALVSELTGGAFVAGIGVLLVGTGLLQRGASRWGLGERTTPDAVDAVLVGLMQGFALLPGVSRSGTTVSALLLRGHDGEGALELSFLLSIPASLGAGLLVVVTEGVPAISPVAAVVALAVSAVVGYLSVGALVAFVRRVSFWGICVGFGALAVVGGVILLV